MLSFLVQGSCSLLTLYCLANRIQERKKHRYWLTLERTMPGSYFLAACLFVWCLRVELSTFWLAWVLAQGAFCHFFLGKLCNNKICGWYQLSQRIVLAYMWGESLSTGGFVDGGNPAHWLCVSDGSGVRGASPGYTERPTEPLVHYIWHLWVCLTINLWGVSITTVPQPRDGHHAAVPQPCDGHHPTCTGFLFPCDKW